MTIITLVRDARVVELADSLDSGSSVHYARAGSSPASRTKQKTLEAARLRGFFFCLEAILALQLALFLRQTLDEPLHTVSTAASHLFCHMTIDIQRKRCCVMTKVFLHCLDVIAAL